MSLRIIFITLLIFSFRASLWSYCSEADGWTKEPQKNNSLSIEGTIKNLEQKYGITITKQPGTYRSGYLENECYDVADKNTKVPLFSGLPAPKESINGGLLEARVDQMFKTPKSVLIKIYDAYKTFINDEAGIRYFYGLSADVKGDNSKDSSMKQIVTISSAWCPDNMSRFSSYDLSDGHIGFTQYFPTKQKYLDSDLYKTDELFNLVKTAGMKSSIEIRMKANIANCSGKDKKEWEEYFSNFNDVNIPVPRKK